MPSKCGRCIGEVNSHCQLTNTKWSTKEIDRSTKPSWCPLKPMPSKRVPDGNETDEIYGCYVGWNACIDEIIGEELIKSFDKKDGVEIDIPIGSWYEETDKRKPDEEMVYLKPDGTEYIWKDDMWVRIK